MHRPALSAPLRARSGALAAFAAAALGMALAAWGPGAHAQALVKCVKDGRTVYQDSKCDEGAASKTLKVESAGRPLTSAECGQLDYLPPIQQDPKTGEIVNQRARGEMGTVVDVLASYQMCSADAPGFASRFGGAYSQWRTRFAAAIASYERSDVARRAVECRLQSEAERVRITKDGDRANKVASCMQIVGPAMEKMAREGLN